MANTVAASDGLLQLNDLESVDWVFNEVEQLLKHVQKILHLYLLEDDKQNDVDSAAQLPSLEPLHAHIKQSAGALRMVNIEVAGKLLESLELVLASFIENPQNLNAQTVQTIDKASFALIEFLQIALKGKPVYPIGLFQSYQALNQIIDVHVQPADLWNYEFHWQAVASPTEKISDQDQQDAISRLDKFMLSLLRGRLSAAQDFKTIALSLTEKSEDQNVKNFWVLVAGFFEALCSAQAGLNINTKRAAAQILNAYKAYQDGTFTVDDSLGKALLFFCVKIKGSPSHQNENQPALLNAIRKAYDLEKVALYDYQRPLYGRIDPLQLKQTQKYIAQAKAVWSAFCSGEGIPADSVINAFKETCQALAHLLPESRQFVEVLYKTVGQYATRGQIPTPEIAMEVATSVLYIEAIFTDTDFDNEELKERFNRLIERIELAIKSGKVLPLDPWIRSLYHTINERETISNVVTELRVMLNGIESNIDDFLRKSTSPQVLVETLKDLHQMHGVLNVLGMDNAAQAVSVMQEQVNWIMQQSAQGIQISEENQEQEQVALLIDNLSSMGFLIDMLGYQPMLARELFIYNEQSRRLELLSSQDHAEIVSKGSEIQAVDINKPAPEQELVEPKVAEPESFEIVDQAEKVSLQNDDRNDEIVQSNEELDTDAIAFSHDVEIHGHEQDDLTIEKSAEPFDVSLDTILSFEPTSLPGEELSSLFTDTIPMSSLEVDVGAVATLVPPSPAVSFDVDGFGDDLREIFLEEANEVIGESRQQIQQLRENPADNATLTALRRAFHSLKGSSRMVGLMDFGTAAYSCEQCLNEWLDTLGESPIPRQVIDFASWALDQFEIWTQELQSGKTSVTLTPELFEQEALLVSVKQLETIHLSQEEVEQTHSGTDNDKLLEEPFTIDELPNVSFEDNALSSDARSGADDFSATLPLDTPSTNSEWPSTQPLEMPEDKAHQAYEQTKEFLSNLSLSLDDTRIPDPDEISLEVSEEQSTPDVEISDDAFNIETLETVEPLVSSSDEHSHAQVSVTPETAQNHGYQEAAASAIEHIQAALSLWQSSGDVNALEDAQKQISILVESLRKIGYIGLASFAQDFESSITNFYQKIALNGVPQNRSSTLILEKIADEFKRLLDRFSRGQTDMPRMDLLIRLYQFGQQNAATLSTDDHQQTSDDSISIDFSSGDMSSIEPQKAELADTQEKYVEIVSDADDVFHVAEESTQEFIEHEEEHTDEFADDLETFDLDISDDQFMLEELPVEETVSELYTEKPKETFKPQGGPSPALEIYKNLHPDDKEAIISDIFEIFDEEAKDLLPLLSSGFREWSIRPSAHDRLVEILRVLHTFKGSARMSSAMHLGNMAHDLETELKAIGEQKEASENQIADVLNRLDDIEVEFENLKAVYIAYVDGEISLEQLAHSNKQPDDITQSVEDITHSFDLGLDVTTTEGDEHFTLDAAAETTSAAQSTLEPGQLDLATYKVITSELFAIFKEETNELLSVIHQGVDHWLKSESPSVDTLEETTRALHTLKGNTRIVSADLLAQLVNQLETTLKQFRHKVPTYPEAIDIQHKLLQIASEFNLLCLAQEQYSLGRLALPEDIADAPREEPLELTEASSTQEDSLLMSDDDLQQNLTEAREEQQATFAQTSLQLLEEIATPLSQWCDQPLTQLDASPILFASENLRQHIALYGLNGFDDLLDTFQKSVAEEDKHTLIPENLEKIISHLRDIELKLLNTEVAEVKLPEDLEKQDNLYSDVLMHQLVSSVFNDDESIKGSDKEEIPVDDAQAQTQQVVLKSESPDEEDTESVELQDSDSILSEIEDEINQADVHVHDADEIQHATEDEQEDLEVEVETIIDDAQEAGQIFDPIDLEDEPIAASAVQKPLATHLIRTDVKPRAINPSVTRKVSVVGGGQMLRVRASLIDELVNTSGELNMQRTQLVGEVKQVKDTLLPELVANLDRLRVQLRDIEIQAETQMTSRIDAARAEGGEFDPLEFDRYTRIQELTRMMAESVSDIDTMQKSLQQSVSNVEDSIVAQSRSSKELQHALLRARMVEFSSITERFYRVVRMAARECGKQAQLTIAGGEIEIDRVVLERIAPAFEHILRNCVVHGIETVAERKSLGKPDFGQIKINLRHEGNDVSISISDDGKGLELEKIREKAIELKLIEPDANLSEHDLTQLIYKSGLTTADEVTELAGRGIGLDMAYSEIVSLGGRGEVVTKTGQGTEFIAVLPLTTAVTQALLVKIEGKTYGIPVGLVESIRRFTPEQVKDAVIRGKIDYLDEEISAYSMAGLLDLNQGKHMFGERKFHWLILHSGEQRIAIAVDQVISSQEVIIRNVGAQFSYLSGFAGLTILSGGHIVLIYNPIVLARAFAQNGQLSQFIELPSEDELGVIQPPTSRSSVPVGIEPLKGDASLHQNQTIYSNKVMVVDDSLTVRRVTQRLLEKAGFDVVLAKDGQDALDQIHDEIPALILSDIEMPRMDGFELVRQLRSSPKTQMLPIIMITSRIAQKHHDYANELGVNYYLGKPYVEEELLQLVRRYVVQAEEEKV